MRWTAVAPVTWPSAQGWDAWWSHAVAEELGQALGLPPDGDGSGRTLEDGDLRLVVGEHLRPGAVYEWVPPEGFTRGRAAGGIGGRADRREIYGEFQDASDARRRVELRVDSLETCRSLSVVSTLRHLALEASFRPEREELLDVEVKLDWLVVQVRARVVSAESGEELRTTLRVVGRGLWKPVIAPLLLPVGIGLGHLLTQETEEAADRLTHLDVDPRGDGAPERELARIRVGAELIRERLHEVVRTVDARPWWKGRRARHLREAFAALPAVGAAWPPVTPAVTFGDSGRWWDEEQWIFDQLIDSNPWRRRRHGFVDDRVDLWLQQQEQMVEHRTRMQAQHRAAEAPLGDHARLGGRELNEALGLSWLASPWSTIRYLARNASSDGDDLPPLETDEDARKFVTGLLKDL